jgi:hypothetical protein
LESRSLERPGEPDVTEWDVAVRRLRDLDSAAGEGQELQEALAD